CDVESAPGGRMATSEVLNFTKLLAPIAGDKPAGIDLRADPSSVSDFYVIRDARKAASDAERRLDERKLDPGNEPVTPDWRPGRDRGTKALAAKSKDLEIAAYVIEALVRLEGFAGLRDGFRLARELVERFWDGLYPLPDEDGVATRVAALTGLNGDNAEGTLINPIARVPITDHTS